MRIAPLTGLALVLAMAGSSTGQDRPLPPPQVSSAVGERDPDFALPDQEGRTLRLSSLRGKRILLIFYRGYW